MKSKTELLIQKWVQEGRITTEVAAILRANPDYINYELSAREKFPSVSFIPNVGQEKALKSLHEKRKIEEREDFPFIHIITGGNGCGKTCTIGAVLLPGVCLGKEFVNREYYDHEFWEWARKKRASRDGLKIRLVCDSADMQENGSLYCEIKKWVPTAKFSGKTGSFYTKICIGNVDIDIKTFNMEINAHAGPNLDLILINEPPPQSIWNENIARLRNGGYMFAFFTPLKGAAFMYNIIHSDEYPDGEICHTEVAIWDNCADIPGKRGHLKKYKIEQLIRQWNQQSPEEVEAREHGRFQHLSGAVFKKFNSSIHVIDKIPDLSECYIYNVIDPHMAKPPFSMWIAVTPLDHSIVIAEYPNAPWDKIKGDNKTISQHCKEFNVMETGLNKEYYFFRGRQIFKRLGDPNILPAKLPNSNMSMKQEYAKCGFNFSCHVSDDIKLGIDAIHENLYYNKDEIISFKNTPKLFVYKNCKNTINALTQFSYKDDPEENVSGKTKKTWECPIACLRYFFLTKKPYYESKYRNDKKTLMRAYSKQNPLLASSYKRY